MSAPASPPMHLLWLELLPSGERVARTVCGLTVGPRHPASLRPDRATCWACLELRRQSDERLAAHRK